MDDEIVLNHQQLQALAELDCGYGVRISLYESDEGGEIAVHVLHRLGYEVQFMRLDGTLVLGEKA